MSESDLVLNKLKKSFGDASASLGVAKFNVPRIQTGIFTLDLGLGGGFPLSRLSEIYGPESSGKTTLAYRLIAYVQRVLHQRAVFVDVEWAFDGARAEQAGVLLDELIVMRPDTAEQVVDMVEAMLYAIDVGIVVVDSVGSMITDNEIESDASKQIVAGTSMLVSKMVRKAVASFRREALRNHAPALVCLNQIRHKIGVMFGDPESRPGGNLLRFTSAMTVRLYAKDKMVQAVSTSLPTFRETSVVVKKWKVPILSKSIEYDMCVLPHGPFRVGDAPSWNTVESHLREYGILKKAPGSGGGYYCKGAHFKTLGELEAKYYAEPELQVMLQKEVIQHKMQSGVIPPQTAKSAKDKDDKPIPAEN